MHYFLAASVITFYIYFRFGSKALASCLILFGILALTRGLVSFSIPLFFISYLMLKNKDGTVEFPWQLPKKLNLNPKKSHSAPEYPTLIGRYIEIFLNPDSGGISGKTIAGPLSQRQLSSFNLEDCISLIKTYHKKDRESEQLLISYMDQSHPEWRSVMGDAYSTENYKAGTIAGRVSVYEAAFILGLGSSPDEGAIKLAHRKLMKKFHPDQGGSPYLAAKINMAKDKLLGN